MLSFSCLRGAKTGGGGKANCVYRCLLFFTRTGGGGEANCVYRCLLFFTRTTKARGKKHKDNNFVPLSLCLKGRGEDDEDL